MQTIEAFNSSLIDSSVERRSFVASPITLELRGAGDRRANAPRHPDGAIPGSREWELTGSILIQASDTGQRRVRLKEFANIEISGDVATIESFDRLDERPIIHWMPTGIAREAELVTPVGDGLVTQTGMLEDFELVVGETYQLERVGFARLEELSEDGLAKLVWLHG
jgi:hypothetical protein